MLDQAKNIFIVGIKGVAMANLAIILKKMGKNVSGSDVDEEFITDRSLKQNNIIWQSGFNPKNIPENTDLMIYSGANQGSNNPQIKSAGQAGIKTVSQAEFLGLLIKGFKTSIAVCGCHGKTTTSSLLSHALIRLGAEPSYLVGSSNFNEYPGGDFRSKDYFVIEADEYGVNPPYDLTPKFDLLNPDYVLCTNIDFDHPDIYKDLNAVKNTFFKFFNRKKLILCADDPNLLQYINSPAPFRTDKLQQNNCVTYGFAGSADLVIKNVRTLADGSSFTLIFNNQPLGQFKISLFGEKNVENAAGAILTLLQLGFDSQKIKSAIKDFTGAKRRFESVYSQNGTYLFDDYAHHPNEIAATISAVRKRFPKKRIIVVFQPHTYSRTRILLADFVKSLSLADKAFVIPIFASARENSLEFKISAENIVELNPEKLIYCKTKTDLVNSLKNSVKKNDVLFTMGAGDVYKRSDDIIKVIKSL